MDKQAEKYGLECVHDLQSCAFIRESQCLIPYAFARRARLIPIDRIGDAIRVAISDPLNLDALEELSRIIDAPIVEVLASEAEIDRAIERCYHQRDEVASEVIASLQMQEARVELLDDTEGYDLLAQSRDTLGESPVIRMVNAILTEAIQQGASDVHFEPGEEGMAVRYRIDGMLLSRHAPPKEYQAQLITRIKVMAKLDIAQTRLPQDGRIKLKLAGRQIDFRVSTVPVVAGERVVLRILDKSHVLLGLDKLGIGKEVLQGLRHLLELSEGIILVTGPTGSGKTTSLYSALAEIHSPQLNIMTIEDPVEYKFQGMAQIGVNPKIDLSFARGLRHILRQDPDVIMIGEIRDHETAEIAIQAALTGHLVLSTLHTNDAPSAITRLVDMGIEPYLLSSSVVGVLAQRLVRMICQKCKKQYKPTPVEVKELGLSACSALEASFYRGEGCAECFQSGYKGRHGIYELMHVTNSIKSQIVKSPDASHLSLLAKKQGMRSLRDEGAQLVLKGITTTAEVLRVTRSCEEE